MRTVRTLVARDLAADMADLLAAKPMFEGRDLVAGDIAVLVGTHDQSALVREALDNARVSVGDRRCRQRLRHPGG